MIIDKSVKEFPMELTSCALLLQVWGLSIHNLIYNLPGEHSRSSLFKNLSQGVTQLQLDTKNRLFSCGADGSIKLRQLPERDLNISLL